MSRFDIEKVSWSAPRIVHTRHGDKQVRTWNIPYGCDDFWDQWRTGNLKQRGYSVSKFNGNWQVTQWRAVGGDMTAGQQRSTESADVIDRASRAAESINVELPPVMAARFQEVEAIYDQIEQETDNDFRYQFPSIKRLAVALDADSGALDASETGVGKTPVACAVAKVLGLELFVICPKSIIPPWRRMARRFGVPIEVINYDMVRLGTTTFAERHAHPYKAMVKGRQVEKVRYTYTWNMDIENTLIVFDECHKLKDYKTMNCQMGLAAIEQGYKVLGLSATAADNPMHMKFVGLLTGLFQQANHFWGWMLSQGVTKAKWGYRFTGGHDILRRIHRQIFPARGSRLRITELGDRFPETQITTEAVELVNIDKALAEAAGVETLDPTRAVELIYAEMHQEIARLEATEAKDKGANILTEILRARQRTELLKVPTFVQMAEDAMEEGASPIIAVNFDATVRALSVRLKTANTITGADKLAARQSLIDAFNEDEQHIVVMNIKAGGLGVSLHGTRNGRLRYVLISPTFSAIDLKQMLGRGWRAGGARSIQKILFAAGTVEERTMAKLQPKLRRIDTLNDGDLAISPSGRN